MASAGSKQMLVDLLLNSNRNWLLNSNRNGLGCFRADLGLICYRILIGIQRKLISGGSEQILVDLLSNSKEIWLGWLRADVGC